MLFHVKKMLFNSYLEMMMIDLDLEVASDQYNTY